MAKKRVLGVVGMGHVGAHVAYALAIQGIADELVLVDQNEQKLASEVQDLRDAVAYMPHRVTVRGGDFSDLGVCDVIVNSVGKIDLLRGTHDRVTEMDFTIPAVRGYAEKIKASGFDGVLINITNPCDIVTRELALHLGLPRGRVFGTGTGLDTSRLLSALARQTGLDHKSITCYMMGEHGNQQFAPWSCVSFRGVPLDEGWCQRLRAMPALIIPLTHNALNDLAVRGAALDMRAFRINNRRTTLWAPADSTLQRVARYAMILLMLAEFGAWIWLR